MENKVIGLIYETHDYDMFKKVSTNRRVSEERMNAIIKSISEKEVLNPIIVDKEHAIIEGQGRFEAKKKLGLPIYYIIDENADGSDCVRLNKNNSPWNNYDYIYSFADAGVDSYLILTKLYEEIKIPISRILRFANKGDRSHGGGGSVIKCGELKFTEQDCSVVRLVKSKCDDILAALQFTKKPNEAFCTAVKVMCDTEGYDHKRMVLQCAKKRNSYSQFSTLSDQLKEFSEIYNLGARGKQRLFFEDYMRTRGHNVRSYDDNCGYKQYDVNDDVSTLKRSEK